MAAPRFISHGILPRARSLRSRDGGPPPTWGERLAALRYVPPLLKLVYQTHRGYTVAILALRAVRSFIPLSVLWVGKLIIDGVIAAVRMHAAGAAVDWWHLGGLIGLELGFAVVGEALARFSSLLESLLGDLFGNRISVRLMQHAATLDLAQFEDAEVYDHLERARRQTVGRIGLFTLLQQEHARQGDQRHQALRGPEQQREQADAPHRLAARALEVVVDLRVFELRQVERRRMLHQAHADAVAEQIAEQALEQGREARQRFPNHREAELQPDEAAQVPPVHGRPRGMHADRGDHAVDDQLAHPQH